MGILPLDTKLVGDAAVRGVGLIGRSASIALGLVLSALLGTLSLVWWDTISLSLLAVFVAIPLWKPKREIWLTIFEMAIAGLVLGLRNPIGPAFLPYLLTAATYWGVRGGLRTSLTGVGTAAVALIASQAYIGDGIDSDSAIAITEWLLLALLGALAGSWSRARQASWQKEPDRYRDAYRLLLELREVTRGLPAALDEVSIGTTVVKNIANKVPCDSASIMRVDDTGPPQPFAFIGTHDQSWFPPPDSWLMRQVKDTNEACQARVWLDDDIGLAPAQRVHRALVPLRLGKTRIGLIALQRPEQWSEDEMSTMQQVADNSALKVDTAFVFSDIRAMATTEERRRLAREIHDGIAQEIAGLAYAIDAVIADTDGDTRADLQAIREELTRVVSELRLSIFELRTDVEPGSGLGASVSDYVRQVGSRSGMTVHMVLEESNVRFSTDVEIEIMRIVQEAVTNARRHSRANNLWVTLRSRPPFAMVRISDDGIGISGNRIDSYGMEIMKERAERIGGRISTRSRIGGGTVVELNLGEPHTTQAGLGHTSDTEQRR